MLINLIKLKKFSLINNKKVINVIDVNFTFKKTFDKISNKSNSYILKSFEVALKLIKDKSCSGLINGPISKKHFLKGKNLGITEYLAKKTKKENKVSMLIFNKKLSVTPITTHLALKDVNKHITKQKICIQAMLINEFYKKQFKNKEAVDDFFKNRKTW